MTTIKVDDAIIDWAREVTGNSEKFGRFLNSILHEKRTEWYVNKNNHMPPPQQTRTEPDNPYTALAREVLASNYNYHGMYNPEECRARLQRQVAHPRTKEEINQIPGAEKFWTSLEYHYGIWKQMQVNRARAI